MRALGESLYQERTSKENGETQQFYIDYFYSRKVCDCCFLIFLLAMQQLSSEFSFIAINYKQL